MIERLSVLVTDNTYPYTNLAVEEQLTLTVNENEVILFLWQNAHTVVIGKNQNAWKECKVEELEKDGGYLVRRLSGGGAVYHDLGNLNFTFCVRAEDYDLTRQLDVVLKAVQRLGIHAERSGRNDITVEGRKFSGNAFLRQGDFCYHHGTIMLDVNGEDLAKYLNVDKKKLASKGVDSVRSRVASLRDFNPTITVEAMKEAMIAAFSEVYGLSPAVLHEEDLDEKMLDLSEKRFASWEWKYGRRIPFNELYEERFSWGDVRLEFVVNEGRIQALNIYSDGMTPDIIDYLKDVLHGIRYEKEEIKTRIRNANITSAYVSREDVERIKEDIIKLIRSKDGSV